MTSEHLQSLMKLTDFASSVANQIVQKAQSDLQSRYDNGNSRPVASVVLDGSVSQRVFELVQGDEDLADRVVDQAFKEAAVTLCTHLRCKIVDVYRKDVHHDVAPGDKVTLSVMAVY